MTDECKEASQLDDYDKQEALITKGTEEATDSNLKMSKNFVAKLFEDLGGENWTDPALKNIEQNRQKNSILDQKNCIVKIELIDNNLTGFLGKYFGDMKSLKTINLMYNNLFGPIPLEIGFLPNLEELKLNSNKLSGENAVRKLLCIF